MDIFYFGCWQYPRYCLYTPEGRHLYDTLTPQGLPLDFPLRVGTLDGGLLAPYQPQDEGRAVLVHLCGWTIIQFWDRSEHPALYACSSFIMRGVLDFEPAVSWAREAFPLIWRRMSFEVICVSAPAGASLEEVHA